MHVDIYEFIFTRKIRVINFQFEKLRIKLNIRMFRDVKI